MGWSAQQARTDGRLHSQDRRSASSPLPGYYHPRMPYRGFQMRHNQPRQKGFTLIELMIVVIVVAILASIAIPSYLEQSRKGRRADAVQAVGDLQLKLESWRAENPSYAECDECVSGDYPTIADSAHYEINVDADADGYTITASPTGAQDGDRCGDLEATRTGKPTWSGEEDCNP